MSKLHSIRERQGSVDCHRRRENGGQNSTYRSFGVRLSSSRNRGRERLSRCCSLTESFSALQDLREHDNFVLDVASTEAIELSSKLAVAQREIGYELSSFLMTRCCGNGPRSCGRDGAIERSAATHTLSSVYRDAYNPHLNDRYLGRWKEFTNSSERGLLRFLHNGVGIAAVAVPQARNRCESFGRRGAG